MFFGKASFKNATSLPEFTAAEEGAAAAVTSNLSGAVESCWPFTSAVSAGMVNTPACRATTEKVTVSVELIAPLMKLMFWAVPVWTICRPRTFGVGTFFEEPPSKTSDSVACSPSVIVSRSSDAVNAAASAALWSNATAASTSQIFIMNRMTFIRRF